MRRYKALKEDLVKSKINTIKFKQKNGIYIKVPNLNGNNIKYIPETILENYKPISTLEIIEQRINA